MTMVASLFALTILFFIGCASTEQRQPVNFPECKAGEFSGTGVGEHESEALSEAHSALAKQINSSVDVITERMVNQQFSNGKENLSSEYESRTTIKAALPNAHDARVLRKNAMGNKINIVVCMAKADAAKGFTERQRLIADSLELASNTALKTEHPKRKNEAWHKTQTLWNEFARIQNLLDGWGIAKASFYEPTYETYSQARKEYKGYCQNMKIHWEDAENECSNAVFAKLSKRINMEKSACSGGFRFRFACEEKCKSLSFGVECSFEPSLAVENCNGERYSLLKATEPITGSDMHNKNRAMENLIEKLPKADFFEKWEKEIKEWVPQCVD